MPENNDYTPEAEPTNVPEPTDAAKWLRHRADSLDEYAASEEDADARSFAEAGSWHLRRAAMLIPSSLPTFGVDHEKQEAWCHNCLAEYGDTGECEHEHDCTDAALATLRGELEETRRELKKAQRHTVTSTAFRRLFRTKEAMGAALRKEAATLRGELEETRREMDLKTRQLASTQAELLAVDEALGNRTTIAGYLPLSAEVRGLRERHERERAARKEAKAEVVRLREALEEARYALQNNAYTDAWNVLDAALAAPTQTTDPSETTETPT